MSTENLLHPYFFQIRNVFGLLLMTFSMMLAGCSPHAESAEMHEDEDEHHHDESTIVISGEQTKKFGIETEVTEPATFREVVKVSGVVEPAVSDIVTVSARKSGIVNLSGGINLGSLVKKGESMATITSDGVQGGDLSGAAAANLSAAKSEYERLKPLYDEKLITASTFREAERAYNEAKALAGKAPAAGNMTLSAPAEGYISALYVNSGQYVDAGAPVATITKSTKMTLRADVPARYSPRISLFETANFIPEGSERVISIGEMGGERLSGKSATNSSGGYIPLYFTFNGNQAESPSGFATVFLLGEERENVISVPRSALLELQGNKYVYVVEDGHEYEKRLVTTGGDTGERVEITSGIRPGETVVSKGASIVRMAEVSAVAPPSHTHNH